MKFRIFKILLLVAIGVFIGGFLFSDTQPRNFLQITNCENNCFSARELAGLVGSVGIQKFPQVMPKVILETERTIVIPHPNPESPVHYLVLPKKDIKNIGEISLEDQDYIMDALAVIRQIVKTEQLTNYQVITNGPGQQKVTYLHFHLMAFPQK